MKIDLNMDIKDAGRLLHDKLLKQKTTKAKKSKKSLYSRRENL